MGKRDGRLEIDSYAWLGIGLATALGIWSLTLGTQLLKSRDSLRNNSSLMSGMSELEYALLDVERTPHDASEMPEKTLTFFEASEAFLASQGLPEHALVGARVAQSLVTECEGILEQLLSSGLSRDERHRLGAEFYAKLGEATRRVHASLLQVQSDQASMLEYRVDYYGRVVVLALVACGLALGMGLLLAANRRSRAALARERRRLDVTLGSITDAVLTTDPEGRLVLVNQATEKLLEKQQADLLGRTLEELFDPGDGNPIVPNAEDVQRILGTGLREKVGPFSFRSQAGEAALLEGSISPLTDGNQQPLGAVLVLEDVTASELHRAELHRLDKLESLGVLAGGIAHDFNNLLTGLLGNVSLVQHHLGDTALEKSAPDSRQDVHAWLEDALLAGEQARGLTHQLLTFARGGEPVKMPVKVEQLLFEACGLVLRGTSVRAVYELSRDLDDLDADPNQIAQVFQNLALNAKQAMPDGGTLTIAARNLPVASHPHSGRPDLGPGPFIEVRLSDQGPGIAEEVIERIFDPYFTTKKGGTGLGLSTAHSIVRRHGGHLSVLPRLEEAGGGTTFVVTLPAATQRASEKPEDPTHAERGSLGLHVLIMDDEEVVRTVTGRMLTRLGCRFASCTDGREAIEACRKAIQEGDPFDAAVLDLTVPGGMGGAEAAAQLRQLDEGIRLIVISGYCEDPVMARFQEHGFDRAMAKPFQPLDLAANLAPDSPATCAPSARVAPASGIDLVSDREAPIRAPR